MPQTETMIPKGPCNRILHMLSLKALYIYIYTYIYRNPSNDISMHHVGTGNCSFRPIPTPLWQDAA